MAGKGTAGFDFVLKIGSSEVGRARDVTVPMTRDELEDTDRSNDGFKSFIAGLGEWQVDLELLYESGNTIQDSIESAFLNGTALTNVQVLDQLGVGFSGNFIVTNFTRNEPLNDVVTHTVTLKGCGKPTKVTGAS